MLETLMLNTLNIPMNAIFCFGAAPHFIKTGGALPKVSCTQMTGSLAFMSQRRDMNASITSRSYRNKMISQLASHFGSQNDRFNLQFLS